MLFVAAINPLLASITDLDVETEGGKQSNNGPRTSLPFIQTSAVGDELSINVYNYRGRIQIVITSSDGTAFSNSYTINGHDCICMDLSDCAVGNYQITITLGNSDVYSGSFRIE